MSQQPIVPRTAAVPGRVGQGTAVEQSRAVLEMLVALGRAREQDGLYEAV